jgi:hypothetical protein
VGGRAARARFRRSGACEPRPQPACWPACHGPIDSSTKQGRTRHYLDRWFMGTRPTRTQRPFRLTLPVCCAGNACGLVLVLEVQVQRTRTKKTKTVDRTGGGKTSWSDETETRRSSMAAPWTGHGTDDDGKAPMNE